MSDPAVILHRADLPGEDIEAHTGFSVARSLIDIADIADIADEDQLARAIGDARNSGLLTIRQLRERAEAIDARAARHVERAIHRAPVR